MKDYIQNLKNEELGKLLNKMINLKPHLSIADQILFELICDEIRERKLDKYNSLLQNDL
jgi:hypothetical protein